MIRRILCIINIIINALDALEGNGQIVITTELKSRLKPGYLRLVIYDAQGRRVRMLASGEFGPGRHRARWDGTDDRGRTVASGVYFARLRVDGREAGARKLALVK